MTGRVRVGLSGWTYAQWRGRFFPEGLPARERLAFASARFPTLKVNATFYRTLRPSTFAGWLRLARPGTTFAVKGPRYVTHMRRLRDVEESLGIFFRSGVLDLGAALGPILWQLPPTLRFDAGLLETFLGLLPTRNGDAPLRHALEPRHASWTAPEAAATLRAHDVALVTSDLAGRYPMFEEVTSELAYIRLHGHERLYVSGYSPTQLEQWASRCRELATAGHDVLVYFDNSEEGRAPHDALCLQERLA